MIPLIYKYCNGTNCYKLAAILCKMHTAVSSIYGNIFGTFRPQVLIDPRHQPKVLWKGDTFSTLRVNSVFNGRGLGLSYDVTKFPIFFPFSCRNYVFLYLRFSDVAAYTSLYIRRTWLVDLLTGESLWSRASTVLATQYFSKLLQCECVNK